MKAEKKSIWNNRLFRDSLSASAVALVVLVIAEVGSHFSHSTWIWHIPG
jgi:hypothetical protein